LIDTGVELTPTDPHYLKDSAYYDLADGWDAYSEQSASAQNGYAALQDNGTDNQGQLNHHGPTVADYIVDGIIDAKNQLGAGGADIKIVPIRDTDPSGHLDNAAIIRGIEYAADLGAAVINLSFEGPYNSIAFGEISLSSAIAYAQSKHCVVVAAAGNDGFNIDQDPNNPQDVYPAVIHASNMLVATSYDSVGGGIVSGMNWGNIHVDVAAATPATS
jgi:hypothetical protein